MPQPAQMPNSPTGGYLPAVGGYLPTSSAVPYPSVPRSYLPQINAGYPTSGGHSTGHPTNYPPAPGAPSITSSPYGSQNKQGPYGGFSYTQHSSGQAFQGQNNTIKVLILLLIKHIF